MGGAAGDVGCWGWRIVLEEIRNGRESKGRDEGKGKGTDTGTGTTSLPLSNLYFPTVSKSYSKPHTWVIAPYTFSPFSPHHTPLTILIPPTHSSLTSSLTTPTLNQPSKYATPTPPIPTYYQIQVPSYLNKTSNQRHTSFETYT